MHPGDELDLRVHKALRRSDKDAVLPYSTDFDAAFAAAYEFFDGGEALVLAHDLDGRWIAHLSHWTNGGKHGPRIWDGTAYRVSYKGLTVPHVISLIIAGFFDGNGMPDNPFTEWEYDLMKDTLNSYDDSQETSGV